MRSFITQAVSILEQACICAFTFITGDFMSANNETVQAKKVSDRINAEQFSSKKRKLLGAARHGNLETVQQLLKEGVNVNVVDDKECTPLWLAANGGHNDVVRELVATPNVELDKPCKYGSSPLTRAVYTGDVETVNILVQAGADIHKADESGNTPLLATGHNAQTEKLKVLLDAGAKTDVNKANDRGETVLAKFAFLGDIQGISMLIANGSTVNTKDYNDWSPLMWAAFHGHAKAIIILINAGANDLNSSLRKAVYRGHDDVVEILLTRSEIDVNEAGSRGEFSLRDASLYNHINIVRMLLNSPNIQVNMNDKNGDTALHCAVNLGQKEVAQLLLKHGANMHQANIDGNTPYYYACGEMRKLLDKYNPNRNIGDNVKKFTIWKSGNDSKCKEEKIGVALKK